MPRLPRADSLPAACGKGVASSPASFFTTPSHPDCFSPYLFLLPSATLSPSSSVPFPALFSPSSLAASPFLHSPLSPSSRAPLSPTAALYNHGRILLLSGCTDRPLHQPVRRGMQELLPMQ